MKNVKSAKMITLEDISEAEIVSAVKQAFDNQVRLVSNRIAKSIRKELK